MQPVSSKPSIATGTATCSTSTATLTTASMNANAPNISTVVAGAAPALSDELKERIAKNKQLALQVF